MKLILKIFGGLLLILIVVILVKTITFKSPANSIVIKASKVEAKSEWLQEALKFKTISHKAGMIDSLAFNDFHHYLDSVFPLVNRFLKKEKVNNYSLIYRLKGNNPALEPLILMAHQDVVPAEYATLSEWKQPPFSGAIKDDYIYGRGALDDKGSLIAILSAMEGMLAKGFKPERTILLCFGHDEEVSGEDGARAIVDKLKEEQVRAYMVLDEGGNLVSGIVPGIENSVALVGVAEKGYVSLQLSTDLAGGHSSMPEKNTAISVLNKAIHQLNNNPMPARLSEPLAGFISHVGPELSFTQKMAFANTWAFKPLIFSVYQKTAAGSALVQTTQAITMFNSGIKDNVIPTRASAVVNYRLLPGDTPEAMLARANKIIGDSMVKVKIYEDKAINASPVSDYKSDEFRVLASCISANFEEVLVTPYLVIAATDARYFHTISDQVYRFSPFLLKQEDLKRLHGINERVSIENFTNAVSFYATVIREMSK